MKKEKSFFKFTYHILSLSKPRNILFSVLLCVCMLFASTTVFADEYTLVSGEYKNRVLVDDYMNELKFKIPEHWKAEIKLENGQETRSYVIKTGTVLSTIYVPIPNTENLSGNFTYATALASTITNGLENYSEVSREEVTIGSYPGVAIGYHWTSNKGAVTNVSLCLCTNQGGYVFTFMMSDKNLDYDLLNDIISFTFAELDVVSFSDANIIKEVQEKLNSLGYDCGTPDGVLGTGTQTAVSNYRKDNGLNESTEINAELLSSLSRKSVASESTSDKNTGDSTSPLMAAEISTAPVKSGDGSKTLGTYAYISVPKNILKTVTMEQFIEFTQNVVKDSGYNWVSIMCDDGTGICFTSSTTLFPSYGKLDTDGAILEEYGYILWDEDKGTYSYLSKK